MKNERLWRMPTAALVLGLVFVLTPAGLDGQTGGITWNADAMGDPVTAIRFTFSANPGALATTDFMLIPGSGSATLGALSGTGTVRYLAVSGVAPGTVSVTVARAGIAAEVRTISLVPSPPVLNPAAGANPANFVRVPGGTFLMGSAEGTPNSQANERPVRVVTVSPFYMSRFPVTQGEWFDVMGSNPSHFQGARVLAGVNWRNLPVENVSWYDALVFSNRLSIARGLTPAYSIRGSTNPDDWGPVPTGGNATWNAVTVVSGSTGYRLPTEAQWEFAARGGHGSPGNFTFSGSNTAAEVAWHNANSGNRTREVGTLRPNALGLYDMSGNASEWVWDWFGNYPSVAQTDPVGASSGSLRVRRGGSWLGSAGDVRSAFRDWSAPFLRSDSFGFRLVRP